MIDDHKKLAQVPGHTQFVCSVNDDKYEEIMSYNDIINHIAQYEDEYIVWKFKHIIAYEGPLFASNPR